MPQEASVATRETLRCEAEVDLEQVYVRHAASVRALLHRLLGPETNPDDPLQQVFVIA